MIHEKDRFRPAYYPKKINKYFQGERLTTFMAISEVLHGNYIWWNGKPYHPSFMLSWPLFQFKNLNFYKAEINPNYKPRNSARGGSAQPRTP